METKFNFNSQVCTSRLQSEKLLALGLKKETADCYWEDFAFFEDYEDLVARIGKPDNEYEIPAWSLHRLIEMTKLKVTLFLYSVKISHPQWKRTFVKHANVWDNLCDCIEWLIKEGYFNKEYLV